jgi:PAS domain S-box-containing protein
VDAALMRILLVDDSPGFLDSANRFLSAVPGLTVVGRALSGEEALEQVTRLRPDVVIMDVSMPGMGGLEATRRIKARPVPPRVLLVSVVEDSELRQSAEQCGADGHLQKLEFADGVIEALRAMTSPQAIRGWDPGAAGLQMLARLNHMTASSVDVGEVLGALARACGEALGAPVVAFWLADESERTLHLRASADASAGEPYPRQRMPYGNGLGWTAAHRLPLQVPDIAADPWLPDAEWFRRRGCASLLAVPVMLQDELLAVLSLAGPGPFTLRPEAQDLLEGLMFLAATAIRNARLRDEARATRDFLRSLADATAEAIVATDVEGRVTYVGGRAGELLGCRVDRLVGRSVQELTACWQDGSRTFADLVGRIVAGQTVTDYETLITTRDGRRLEASASIAPLRGPAGAVTGGVAMIRDVTDQRRIQRALEHAQKMAAMGSWLAGVANELSSPFTVMVGQAEVLRITAARKGEGALSDMATRILESATRSAQIVKSVLGLARLGAAAPQRVSVNGVVLSVLDAMAATFEAHGVEASRLLATDLPAVAANPDQLHEVVANLVSNAVHAVRGGPSPRWVRVETRLDAAGSRIVLEVADSGPGVPEQMRERIFEPFFTTKPVEEGVGLGLALCRRLVMAYGGTIRVGSAVGGGAAFTVELPAWPR